VLLTNSYVLVRFVPDIRLVSASRIEKGLRCLERTILIVTPYFLRRLICPKDDLLRVRVVAKAVSVVRKTDGILSD